MYNSHIQWDNIDLPDNVVRIDKIQFDLENNALIIAMNNGCISKDVFHSLLPVKTITIDIKLIGEIDGW